MRRLLTRLPEFSPYPVFVLIIVTCLFIGSCVNHQSGTDNENFVDQVTIPAIDTSAWSKNDVIKWAGNDPSKWPAAFSIGTPVSKSAIDSIDIDVMPDGRGLPAGKGHASQGRKIYLLKCAACHGNSGREGPDNRLVSLKDDTTKEKTIGNYWPYATTVFDYIRRAMPLNSPGSLTDAEVYHLTTYLLSANKIIDSTTILTADNLSKIKMPAHKLFINDNRKGGHEIK
ncbi:c-type cytochrome [Flavitalea antarctica]